MCASWTGVRLGAVLAILVCLSGAPAQGSSAPAARWSAVAIGADEFICAIRSDRSLWCWGNNSYGELGDGTTADRAHPVLVSGGGFWSAVAPGLRHACGLRTDSTLWCWGDNGQGQLGVGSDDPHRTTAVRVGTATNWATVSSDDQTTCATRTDGSLWCWGDNLGEQFDDGTTEDRNAPVRVQAGTQWSSVSVGKDQVCGIPTTGAIRCWGSGFPSGLLGENSDFTRASWGGIEMGGHTCAVNNDHALWCWGANDHGQLGNGSTTDDHVLARPASTRSWATAAVGASHTCALTTGGDMWCWGFNGYGQLGDNTTEERKVPVAVNADLKWKAVAAAGERTCGLTDSGALWCWGSDIGTLIRAEPLRVGTDTGWAQVDTDEYTCAVRTDKSLWCWGSDAEERLGDGVTRIPGDGAKFKAPGRWKSVAVGGYSICGVLADVSLWCSSYTGRMYTIPAQKVGAPSTWSGVTVGGDNACGLKANATLWCWGVPPGRTQMTPVYDFTPRPVLAEFGRTWASVAASCALDTEGKVWCWADEQSKGPVDLPAATRFDAGWGTVCAVTTDHSLWCWGPNDHGQLGNGTTQASAVPVRVGTAHDWADVSVGRDHLCGIRTDTSLWCWGKGGTGLLGNSVTRDQHTPIRVRSTAGWLSVSAGSSNTCGIQRDHSLWCWGDNYGMRLGAATPVRRHIPVPALGRA
ncbi:hypothetical protein [Actinoplanes sp. NPDC026619]|uniref:RCC1 domain-containing protein n=1 Tax=Actinoplanes sp. NPDC026619 TaxID=3155798 RepID=UPI0033BFCF8C